MVNNDDDFYCETPCIRQLLRLDNKHLQNEAVVMGLLNGKNAIITGCNRGIGKATMEEFASQGANIWACARSPSKDFENNIATLSEKYDSNIVPVYFDITEDSSMKNAIMTIKKEKKPVDILINIAGQLPEYTSFWTTSIDKMKSTFEVNFFATSALTQYISRLMITNRGGGSIVNVASVTGIDGALAPYEYIASKAALIGGTKCLAHELSKYKIRVNAVAPGWSKTRMIDEIAEDISATIISKISLNRYGEPSEIAKAIAFLASDCASYITGQVLRVDGGIY